LTDGAIKNMAWYIIVFQRFLLRAPENINADFRSIRITVFFLTVKMNYTLLGYCNSYCAYVKPQGSYEPARNPVEITLFL